jgi:hypothetical protein
MQDAARRILVKVEPSDCANRPWEKNQSISEPPLTAFQCPRQLNCNCDTGEIVIG